MCGIVGAVSSRNVTSILLDGVGRLEYRGYDSAGIAVINAAGKFERLRAPGKVRELRAALTETPLSGHSGIAHTRWATHGVPNETNAHPHLSNDSVAVVHNGIIENYETLREKLLTKGYTFSSDTDTEVVTHLFHLYFSQEKDLLKAALKTAHDLEGAYALGILTNQEPDQLIAIRRGSPLVIGVGKQENFIASDHLALLPVTQTFIYLEEGDIALVRCEQITIFNEMGKEVTRATREINQTIDATDRGAYRHFMAKEIFSQPEAITATLEGRLSQKQVYEQIFGAKAAEIFSRIQRVQIVACGTSYHAGMVARYWLEGIAGIPTQVEIASEIRYRKAVVEPGTLLISISQSGETADTLAAVREGKKQGYEATLAICNVAESSLVRESDLSFQTRAGVEIGVASTKAFVTQLCGLLLLTVVLGRKRLINPTLEKELIHHIYSLPHATQKVLDLNSTIEMLARGFITKRNALFLGRGVHYPIALEGALKLKEISYLHAEAYAAGELKHGPLALVDADMPVIAIAPNDELLEKIKSNLQEVRARGGELIVFADEAANLHNGDGVTIINMPSVAKTISPIIYTIPLQLLAYHVAVLKGTDVDQPRNLAKSVTVE